MSAGTRGEPMSRHTSLRVGGPADLFVRITSQDDLEGAVRVAREHEVATFILGGGTNLLVADKGIRGVVLENAWVETEVEDVTIDVSSGTPLAHLAAVAARSGILDLEWMATIPGTVGGAIHGNAGAFGADTAGNLVDAVLMDLNGETWTVARDELEFAYRTSGLQGTPIIVVRARFRGRPGARSEAVRRIKEMANERAAKQPLAQPNTGSIFRNPPGDFAGRLIEAAGLKGVTEGGAKVSERHANFIVNTGSATAADIRALIVRCQETVLERFGVSLVTEVELVGEW